MERTYKILVVEDDLDLRESLKDLLRGQYTVFTASNGEEGIEIAKATTPTIIVLDLMMPKQDGYEALELLRSDSDMCKIPVLMLTGLNAAASRIRAFELGADDYIGKPFEPEELLARVKAKIRLVEAFAPQKRVALTQCGNLTLNSKSLDVRVSDKPVKLSFLEFNLLSYLVRHRNKLRTRNQILDAVWRTEYSSNRILDPHITVIRRKLADFDHEIVAVYGGGYMLRARPDALEEKDVS
jgi:DNA-binding response OmpR family regulator